LLLKIFFFVLDVLCDFLSMCLGKYTFYLYYLELVAFQGEVLCLNFLLHFLYSFLFVTELVILPFFFFKENSHFI
jgi:hypothetical protein